MPVCKYLVRKLISSLPNFTFRDGSLRCDIYEIFVESLFHGISNHSQYIRQSLVDAYLVLAKVEAILVIALIKAILMIAPIRANTRFAPTLEKISL